MLTDQYSIRHTIINNQFHTTISCMLSGIPGCNYSFGVVLNEDDIESIYNSLQKYKSNKQIIKDIELRKQCIEKLENDIKDLENRLSK